MNNIKLRKARVKDIDYIRRMSLSVDEYHYKNWNDIFALPDIRKGPTRKRIKKYIRSKKDTILVAFENKLIIGLIIVEVKKGKLPLKENKHVFLKTLYVAREHRKRGIAIALIEKSKEYASKKRINEVRLDVFGCNDQAIKLYTKLGFTNFISLMTYYKRTIK